MGLRFWEYIINHSKVLHMIINTVPPETPWNRYDYSHCTDEEGQAPRDQNNLASRWVPCRSDLDSLACKSALLMSTLKCLSVSHTTHWTDSFSVLNTPSATSVSPLPPFFPLPEQHPGLSELQSPCSLTKLPRPTTQSSLLISSQPVASQRRRKLTPLRGMVRWLYLDVCPRHWGDYWLKNLTREAGVPVI